MTLHCALHFACSSVCLSHVCPSAPKGPFIATQLKAKSKAKMCNGRRHVPASMPSLCKRKISSAKVQLYYNVIISIYLTSVPDPG